MKNLHSRRPGAALSLALLPSQAAIRDAQRRPPTGARSRRELGGERVDVYTATTAMQDVHRVEAKPSLGRARPNGRSPGRRTARSSKSAGCRCSCRSPATPKIQRGAPGFFEATSALTPDRGADASWTAHSVTFTRSAIRTFSWMHATLRRSRKR